MQKEKKNRRKKKKSSSLHRLGSSSELVFPWQPRTRNTAVAISSLELVLAATKDGTALLPAVLHGLWHVPLVSWLSQLGLGIVTHIHPPWIFCQPSETAEMRRGPDKLPIWQMGRKGGSTCKDCLGDGHLCGWSFTVFEVGKQVISEGPWR